MLNVRTAQVIGRDHILRGINCQDSYAVIERDAYAIGVICDGCGEGKKSEIGATLAADYLAGKAAKLFDAGILLADLPGLLYPHMIDYLRDLVQVSEPGNPFGFICDHLLFTILGMIVTRDGGVIFAAGDGLVMIDDDVNVRDQGNQPSYIAYHLLAPAGINGRELPDSFDIYALPDDWERLVIASDGFEVDLLSDLWDITHPRGLQRRLNLWSNREHRFHDDATLITLERALNHAGQDRR